MASRSNTALQASVILLIILVVILGVTTYVFYSKQDSYYRDMQAAKEAAERQQTSEGNYRFAVSLLKRVLGRNEVADVEIQQMRADLERRDPKLFAEIKAIEDQFEEDMRLFPAGHPDAKNYVTLPPTLWQIIKDLNQKLSEQQQRVAQLTAEKDSIAATEADKTKKAEDARDEALAAKTAAEATFAAERDRMVKQNSQLAAEKAEMQTKIAGLFDKGQAEKKDLEDQINRLTQTVQNQSKKLEEMTSTSFARPDGSVIQVQQSNGILWINLGNSDGLRRQQTFSVYDKDETDFETAKPKGTIEVTSVDQPKMAQARIMSDEISDPILPGDIVFSPTWQPGQRLHFALAGALDIDEDGRADNRKVRDLITLNGGIIDAEVDEKGGRTGSVSLQTRYIVVGDRPTEKSNATVTGAYTSLIGQAGDLGIETISVVKLLEMMGHTPERRTQQLGRGAGIESGAPSPPKFRSRTPGSAY